MDIGLPKEIKNNENRVGLTPAAVAALTKAGHKVFVQKSAGLGSGFSDAEYVKAKAKIVNTANEAWNHKMIVKVKEPLASEYKYFKPDMLLFTYLHLADNKPLTDALLKSRVCGIAYETMIDKNAKVRLPLLAPMSRVAGRRSAIIAATFLESHRGGLGLLPGGVEDNDPAKPSTEKGLFLVIGGGIAGYSAATMAAGMGANVTILEANPARIQQLKKDVKLNAFAKVYKSKISVENAGRENISKWIKQADALISTVLIPGAKAPKVVSAAQVKTMKKGSIIIDIAIDQGGSVETINRVTTHDNPVYVKFDASHYAVANMPGATPRTSTVALVNATTKFAIEIASKGLKSFACPVIFSGVNTFRGCLTNESVAKALKIKYVPINTSKL
ncbi:MAG: alanine dehydrogenase [Mycoplasmataceae bacterium]|nr:alanine dehydrogenase [Mycoplasmataceae bacterium]